MENSGLFIVVSLLTNKMLTDENNVVLLFDREEDAYITCSICELEDVWICELKKPYSENG